MVGGPALVTGLGGREWWRGYCAVVVDNVLWIITDDQMRSSLRSMDRTWKRLVDGGAVPARVCRDAVVRAGARVDTDKPYVHIHGCSTNLTNPRFVAQGLDRDTVATRILRPATTPGTSAST